MPSFVLNIPGPGAYTPQYMQREMRAGHYELWPQERHAVETRLAATRDHYEMTAAKVQEKVEADIRRQMEFSGRSKSISVATVDTSHMRRPPHAGGPLGTARDGVPLRSVRLSRTAVLDQSAGTMSAKYPTMQPAARPVYPRFSDGPVRPSTTPLTVSRYPSATTRVVQSAEARTLRLLNQLYAVARRGEALPVAPIQPHPRRLPSSRRGLSLPALRAVRSFYSAQGGLTKLLSEMTTGFGQGPRRVPYASPARRAREAREKPATRPHAALAPHLSSARTSSASRLLAVQVRCVRSRERRACLSPRRSHSRHARRARLSSLSGVAHAPRSPSPPREASPSPRGPSSALQASSEPSRPSYSPPPDSMA
jgi:hypothetical protein